MTKPIIAVDIDGVINDFHTPFVGFLNRALKTNYRVDEFYSHNFHHRIGVSEVDSLKLLNEFEGQYRPNDHIIIDGAKETLGKLNNHYKIISITSRRPILELVTREFMNEHFPYINVYFAVGRNNLDQPVDRKFKPEIAEELGAICLIDDNENEFIHWDSNAVQPIIYAQPWNEQLSKSHSHIPRLEWAGIKRHLLDGITGG